MYAAHHAAQHMLGQLQHFVADLVWQAGCCFSPAVVYALPSVLLLMQSYAAIVLFTYVQYSVQCMLSSCELCQSLSRSCVWSGSIGQLSRVTT